MLRTCTTERGFSLIEMLIYTAILSAVMVVVVSSLLSLSRSYISLAVSKDINSSAITSLDRITREIRFANDINVGASTLGIHPGRIVLNTTDASGNPTTIEFYVNNGTLSVREGGIDAGTLTKANVTIKNLVFYMLDNGTSKAVKVDLELTSTRGTTTKTAAFHSTSVLRGGY